MMNSETGENKQNTVNEFVDARLGVHTINAVFLWKEKGKSEGLRD